MQIKTAFTDAILSAVVPLTDEEQRRHDFATAALDMARRSLLSEYAKLMRELVRSVRQSSWQRSHADLLKTVSYDDYVTWTEYFQGFACRKMLPSGIRQIACKFSLVLGHCEYLCSPDRKHGAIFASLPGGGRILLLQWGPDGSVIPDFEQVKEVVTFRKRIDDQPIMLWGMSLSLVLAVLLVAISFTGWLPNMADRADVVFVTLCVIGYVLGFGFRGLWRRRLRLTFARMHKGLVWAL